MLVPTSVMHAARLPKRHCALLNYFAVAGYGGISRDFAGYGGIERSSCHQKPTKFDLPCAELIFSAAGTGTSKLLILVYRRVVPERVLQSSRLCQPDIPLSYLGPVR